MSAIKASNVWVEYGDQIVLERIDLEIASGAFVVDPSARRAAASRPSCAWCWARSGRLRGDPGRFLDGCRRCRASPARIAASCFSATRSFRI